MRLYGDGKYLFDAEDRVVLAEFPWLEPGTVKEIVHNTEPGMEAQELCVVEWDEDSASHGVRQAFPHYALAPLDPKKVFIPRGIDLNGPYARMILDGLFRNRATAEAEAVGPMPLAETRKGLSIELDAGYHEAIGKRLGYSPEPLEYERYPAMWEIGGRRQLLFEPRSHASDFIMLRARLPYMDLIDFDGGNEGTDKRNGESDGEK